LEREKAGVTPAFLISRLRRSDIAHPELAIVFGA